MKKLLLLLIMISSISLYAQDDIDTYFSLSIGADAKGIFEGNKDITFDAHAVAEDIDFNLGYEMFNNIQFYRKYVALGYHIKAGYISGTNIKFSIQPSLEWSNITRGILESDQDKRSYSTPSANINWNWDINNHFAFQIYTGLLPRVDLKIIYHEDKSKISYNSGCKIVYKF